MLVTGVCCQFVNKRLAPASRILFLVLAFGSRDSQDVSIYGHMSIDTDVSLV
jgi:hypothetical protein